MNHFSKRIFGALFAFFLLLGVATIGTTTAQGQWSRDRRNDDYRRDRRDDDWRRDRRDNDYRRDRTYDQYGRNRGYYNVYDIARQQGYSYGLSTGAADAQRGQSYKPQRSRYFKDATEGYRSEFGNKGQYKQVFRDAFVQGYNEGYQRYAYDRRTNNGRWGNGTWWPRPR